MLVHGAWHGGWCWRYVRAHLEQAGHRVYTPTMTGLGERMHLNTRSVDLTTHATDIVKLIEYEELEDIVLVGHSYAGYVISLVADKLKHTISQLVYLDASLPTENAPFMPDNQHSALLERYGKDFVLPVAGMDFLGIPDNHPKVPWVRRHLTPHPLGTLLEPVKYEHGGASTLPETFIRCLDNPRYAKEDPVREMAESDPEWGYVTIDTGHDAMVTAPEALSAILLEIR